MNKIANVPDVVPLDDESVFCLSIARAFLLGFPSSLRKFARLNAGHLQLAIESKEISVYGLVSGAYIGSALLPISHRRFTNEADRINKLGLNPSGSLDSRVARYNSAAQEFGMSRGEFMRLIRRLDDFAVKFAGVDSYDDIFNCNNRILNDHSAAAPADRETYAEGPLYLWDFAKAVAEHDLVGMRFDTFGGWVLFVRVDNGIVSGHAVHPRALRLGNFTPNPLICVDELRMLPGPCPIVTVPQEVQMATRELARRHFPDSQYHFVLPPLAFLGGVYSSKPIVLKPCLSGAEG